MFKISLNNQLNREYKNHGQHAEQVFRFTFTGKILKADNVPATQGADISDIQVKSSRATVCQGSLENHLANDKAKRYAYVVDDFSSAYIMSKNEYKSFVVALGQVDRESHKNGGKEKIRLPKETKKLMAWLENH